MDNIVNVAGEYGVSCGDFSVVAQVGSMSADLDAPQMGRIDLMAVGPNEDGTILLNTNGRIASKVGQSSIDLVEKGIVLDAGDQGNIGLRAGTAPAMQHIELGGNGRSIVLENGQIPLTPKIEIKVDSIEISVGASKITIGPTGIEISSLNVKVDGSLEAKVNGTSVAVSGTKVDVSGTMVTVKGAATAELSASGATTVKGAMVMIN